MPPKARYICMDKDDAQWEKLDIATAEWEKTIRTSDVYRAVARLILKYRPGDAKEMHVADKGGYNIIYRLEYKDGSSAIMRIPIKGVVPFPEEKVRYEVATMRHVAAHTTIPVPEIYHYGTGEDNPTGLGPFIIMEYIPHHQNMSRELLDPSRDPHKRPVLDPQISQDKLERLYGQMANIMLQLDSLEFPRIGSLVDDGESISVRGRPLIANMTDLAVHTHMPADKLPAEARTYDSEMEWYADLADMHMVQLVFQENDAVEDEQDAKDKYVARQLFRNLAKRNRLAAADDRTRGFRLFSEDLRPANVLLDTDLRFVAVIDWEFA